MDTTSTQLTIDEQIAEAMQFLRTMFDPQDWIELRLLPSGKSHWFRLDDGSVAEEAVRAAVSLNAQDTSPQNVYVGANPRDGKGRKTDAAVPLARSVFADFDDGATVDGTLTRISAACLPAPSILVVSGGGVHAYWLLDEPMPDTAAWRAAMEGIIAAVESDKSIKNPERIMRLPGTRNVKPERPERPWCRIVSIDDVRHPINAFPVVRPATKAAKKTATPGRLGDVGQRFLETGHVDRPRRETLFTIACDMKARGWPVDTAVEAIMSQAGNITPALDASQLADLPRQIHNAYKQAREPAYESGSDYEKVLEWRPFPDELLPDAVRGYVTQTADGMAADPVMVVLPLLAALGSAIGNSRCVRLKHDWEEPPVIWAAIVAESGSMKTPTMRKALQFVLEDERLIEDCNRQALQEYEQAKLEYDAAVTTWKKKGGTPPVSPEKPKRIARAVSDTTIEAVARILADNPRGLLLERDELSGWLGGFERYKSGGSSRVSAEVGHWLSMHNARPLRLDRVSAGRVYVPRASLCIAGGIQPETLTQAIGREHVVNGLLARFLLAAPPRRRKKFNTTAADFAAVEAARRVFQTLYAVPAYAEEDPAEVGLSRDGLSVWEEFYDRHALRQQSAEGAVAAMLAKIEAAAARLALIHHACRQASTEPTLPHEIDAASVRAGVGMAEWFAHEWERVFNMTVGSVSRAVDDGSDDELLSWIAGRGGEVPRRDIARNLRRYQRQETLDKTLARLIDAGQIETFDLHNERGGPPAAWVRLIRTATKRR